MGQGPLNGVKIVEFAGIGPGPFCGMLLSDMGADVIRIDRPGSRPGMVADVTARGRRSIALNLKDASDIETALKLLEKADGVIEGFRPGVMERNGLGPDVVLARNPRLVYGRMTGWGQTGTLANAAGHDLNYIALTGGLHAMGRKGEPPAPPLNLVGDYGGGALYLAFGLCAGILHARETGQGQVIDCAMTDGAASLASMFYGMRAMGLWNDNRQDNLLDGGAHFYDTYECSDGSWVSIGSIEPQFYAELVARTGASELAEGQMNPANWVDYAEKLTALFKTKTQAEWNEILEGTDVCYGPVIGLDDAPEHPHMKARKAYVEHEGALHPAPAPRFSRTPGEVRSSDDNGETVVKNWLSEG